MSGIAINNWQDVQAEVLDRIHSRVWKPGDQIPKETELAAEFGCARATVNRALRAVAEAGFLDRKRKAGTRVATHPIRKATLSIPIIRHEIEESNRAYSYALEAASIKKPPAHIQAKMDLAADQMAHHSKALHFANNQTFASEERWINIHTVPDVQELDFTKQSANEWLVANAPFTHGNISLLAIMADLDLANRMGVAEGTALFGLNRTTWDSDNSITTVKLVFHPGYALHTKI